MEKNCSIQEHFHLSYQFLKIQNLETNEKKEPLQNVLDAEVTVPFDLTEVPLSSRRKRIDGLAKTQKGSDF